MKKNYWIILAAVIAPLAFTQCNKEVASPETEETAAKENIVETPLTTLVATIDPATKTQLVSGNKVEWLASDEISLFDGAANIRAVTTDSGSSAKFSAALTTEGPWYALYPYNASAVIDGGVITTALPHEQTAVAGSFADDLNMAVALSEEDALAFKNVLGLIKFSIGADADIVKVTLTGNNAETLAGTVNIDYNSGDPTWDIKSEAATSIELSGTFVKGQTYYFAVLPQTFTKGITLTYTNTSEESRVETTSNELVLGRSKIRNIGSPDIITFADPDVKAALVARFDANGDGEISKAEAEMVTYKSFTDIVKTDGADVSKLWDPLTIDTFDEFRYFTGLVSSTYYRIPPIFRGCENLTSVKLPSNATQISGYAFNGCSSLEMIDLPEGLLQIMGNAFSASGIKDIIIPSTVTAITPSAFNNCASLETVQLPNEITTALPIFKNCTALKSVNIPKTVTGIPASHFSGFANLETVTIPEDATLETIGNDAFKGCTALAGDLYIPNSVTTIGNNAFQNCSSLVNVNFADSGTQLVTIGDYAFQNCTALAGDLYIPNSVTTIGNNAFQNCSSLVNVNFADSGTQLVTIGDYAFQNCTAMKKFNLPSSNLLESIGQYAFDGCKKMSLKSRNLQKVKSIGQYAFQKTKIANLTITSDELTKIGRNAFYDCTNLMNVYLSSHITEIEGFAFSGCTSLTGLSSEGTGKTGIILPEGLETIGNGAFGGCVLIQDADFPSTLTSIGNNVFRNGMHLTTWTIRATTPPTLGTATFKGDSSVGSILVPGESLNDYKAATNWSNFAEVMSGF